MENPGLCLTPFQCKYLLKNLETDLRAEYRRRIEIMLLFDAGQTQAQICKALGCSQKTARYWIAIASSKQAHKWSDRPCRKIFSVKIIDLLHEVAVLVVIDLRAVISAIFYILCASCAWPMLPHNFSK